MTITIDDPWRLLGCVVIAVILLWFTAGIVVPILWGAGPVRATVGLLAAAAGAACAILLVMAGGGWL